MPCERTMASAARSSFGVGSRWKASAFVFGLHDRRANLDTQASDALALSLNERRLPQRIRRLRP